MKRLLSFVLIVAFVLSIPVLSAQAEEAEFTRLYSYASGDGGAYVGTTDKELSGKIIIPKEINGRPVVGITENGFKDCSKITEVVLPDTVTEIGKKAFSGCSSMESINIPDGVEIIGAAAFNECTSLTGISIPDAIESIGDLAFCGCWRINEFSLPDKVIDLGNNILFNSGYYKNVDNWDGNALYAGKHLIIHPDISLSGHLTTGVFTLREGTITIADEGVGGRLSGVNIPDSLKRIGREAFRSSSLKSIVIPEGVEYIGERAFYYSSALTDIKLPGTLKYIGSNAFNYTGYADDPGNWRDGALYIGNSLVQTDSAKLPADFVIKEGTVCVADNVFYKCDTLRSITISKDVRAICSGAASYCNNLESIIILGDIGYTEGPFISYMCENVTSVTIAEGVIGWDNKFLANCKKVESVSLPSTLEYLGDGAFYNWRSLKSIKIPDSVKYVGRSAFYGCEALTQIHLPDSVENSRIEDSTFMKCEQLTELNIQCKINAVGKNAFRGCSSLQKIELSDTVTTIGERAFEDCTALSAFVIPPQVTEIGYRTFGGCKKLTDITLPVSVKSVDEEAFDDAYLKEVWYDGYSWDKSEIEIADGNNRLKWALWHCLLEDVGDDHPYAETVKRAVEARLVSGVKIGRFSPDTYMTRAQAATLFMNASGEKYYSYDVDKTTAFSDVNTRAWYFPSIKWAEDNGLVKGVGNRLFMPDEYITREQLCVLMIRFLNDRTDKELTFSEDALLSAKEAGAGEWACEAVAACIDGGIATVNEGDALCPKEFISRAEATAICLKMYEKYMV